MSEKTAVAIQSMKSAQAEMTQWENRIESAKQEYNNMKRQSETLEQEIIAKRTDFQAYLGSRDAQLRQGIEKLLQDQKTLEAQREEFKSALDTHLKEKGALAQEKIEFANEKSRVDGRRTLVNDFIQAVRRAYNVLPD